MGGSLGKYGGEVKESVKKLADRGGIAFCKKNLTSTSIRSRINFELWKLSISKKIEKRLRKLPTVIREKIVYIGRILVESVGIRENQKKEKGYHDEPLKGKRKGQRSIRLNRSWRAIYREEKDRTINLIIVEEVHKHDY